MRTTKLDAQRLADMGDEKFNALMQKFEGEISLPPMPEIIAASRNSTMQPRKPRGEKPATTIRLLRRQLTQMEQTIGMLRRDIGDKQKVIAGYDAQLEESDNECRRLQDRCANQSVWLGEAKEAVRRNAERLAFLEGYYAAHQEARETISIPRASLAGDPPQTHAARGPGNPCDLSAGRPRGEETRQD